jgi:hypothetical protein
MSGGDKLEKRGHYLGKIECIVFSLVRTPERSNIRNQSDCEKFNDGTGVLTGAM